VARAVVGANARAVASAESAVDDDFVAAAATLARCRGKVVVTGSGTSGCIAERAAHLLSVGGTPAFAFSPADGLHGGLGAITADDVVLALSKGGGSDELNAFCLNARDRAAALVVVTATADTALAAAADHRILLTLPPDVDLGGIIATGSSLAAAAVTDALVEASRRARGYGFDEVLATHPGGAVGRASRAPHGDGAA
jgi:arabinose-5-phosphate isomerase